MRAPALALAAGLLLLPFAGALPGAAPAAPDQWFYPLRILLTPGQSPVVEVGDFSRSVAEGGNASRCQVFAPMELTCRGDEVYWAYDGTPWAMLPGIGLESTSNTWVHLVQEVNATPVFAFSLKTNVTHWLAPWLVQEAVWLFEVEQWGVPQTDVATNVRLDVSHLPAASEFTFGGWHAYFGPPV